MTDPRRSDLPGPFRADQLRPGDRYELDRGHAIYCAPSGRDHGRAAAVGAQVLGSDPDVEGAVTGTGFDLGPGVLRAPDVAVGDIPDRPGFAQGAPALAVEYASRGQDEEQLVAKIDDLLTRGTQFVWVVRLIPPRRVEVHAPGQKMQVFMPGEDLLAPGVLRNPVPVVALFDRKAADRLTLSNLLERFGYADPEEIREEGLAEGGLAALRQTLTLQWTQKFGAPGAEDAKAIAAADSTRLQAALGRILSAVSPAELLPPVG